MSTQPVPHPPEMKERAYKLFAQRIPLAGIADRLTIPVDTIRKWSSKGKWKTRLFLSGAGGVIPTSVQPGNGSLGVVEGIEAQLAKLVNLPFEEKQGVYRDLMANEALRAALSIQSVPSSALVQQADKVKKLDEVARRALHLEEDKPAVIVNVALLGRGVVRQEKQAVATVVDLEEKEPFPVAKVE